MVVLVGQLFAQPGPVTLAVLLIVVPVGLLFTVTLKVSAKPLECAATEVNVKVTVLAAKPAVQLATVPQLADPAT